MKAGDIVTLEIQDLAFGGKSISKLQNDFVVFIDSGLPGQTVEVKIKKKKKNYAEAKFLKVLNRSPQEVENEYQVIGGAPWAKLPVEIQQSYKETQVVDLFRKFGGLDIKIDSFISSPVVWGYRNKVEYSFGPTDEALVREEIIPDSDKTKKIWEHTGFGLGFKKRGQFWMVESLRKPSGLFDEEFETQMHKIEALCEATGLPVYNARTQEGFWRNLVVRKSFDQDQFLICMGTSPFDKKQIGNKEQIRADFKNLLLELYGDRIAGIWWQESKSLGDSIRNFETRDLLSGDEKIVERINGLSFEISLDSFFQTNPKSAERLYGLVVESVKNNIEEDSSLILDLFCGTGTIGQIIKAAVPQVKIIGVEIVPEAIEDAKKNAERNNIEGIEFFADDVGKFLKAFPEHRGNIDVVVLDPPRAGIAPKTLKKVIELQSKTIVYVSCNPATMARDTETLLEAGYSLETISCVDQFPHTSHVECVGVYKSR